MRGYTAEEVAIYVRQAHTEGYLAGVQHVKGMLEVFSLSTDNPKAALLHEWITQELRHILRVNQELIEEVDKLHSTVPPPRRDRE